MYIGLHMHSWCRINMKNKSLRTSFKRKEIIKNRINKFIKFRRYYAQTFDIASFVSFDKRVKGLLKLVQQKPFKFSIYCNTICRHSMRIAKDKHSSILGHVNTMHLLMLQSKLVKCGVPSVLSADFHSASEWTRVLMGLYSPWKQHVETLNPGTTCRTFLLTTIFKRKYVAIMKKKTWTQQNFTALSVTTSWVQKYQLRLTYGYSKFDPQISAFSIAQRLLINFKSEEWSGCFVIATFISF